jgi:hypothetical protein
MVNTENAFRDKQYSDMSADKAWLESSSIYMHKRRRPRIEVETQGDDDWGRYNRGEHYRADRQQKDGRAALIRRVNPVGKS